MKSEQHKYSFFLNKIRFDLFDLLLVRNLTLYEDKTMQHITVNKNKMQ